MPSVDIAFKRAYVDSVLSDLKTDGYLTKGMAQMRTGVKADVVQWTKAGRLVANKMAPGIETRPANEQAFDIVEARLEAYECNADVNVLDMQKMTLDQRREAQKATKNAIGAAYDQVFVDALNAGAPTSGANMIGDGSAAITLANLLTAQTRLFAAGIKATNHIYAAVSYPMLAALMAHTAFANADYNGGEAVFKKALGARSWLNMHIVPFPDAVLPTPSAGVKDGFIWIKDAVGQTSPTDAEGAIAEGIGIHWDFMRKCWRVNSTMMIGAKVLIPEGVQRLRFLNTDTITLPT